MSKNDAISEFLASRIAANDFPSAVYLVAEKGEILYQDALGLAVVEPEQIEARIDTIYDLASLTKVLVTGLLCAKLVERGELILDKKLGFYLTEFTSVAARENGTDDVTVIDALTHNSGYQAWKPFYLLVNDRAEIPSEVARTPKRNAPPAILYSDLNFLALTFLIERILGDRIDAVAEREIFKPLGLNDTFYNPPGELRRRIAASETGNRFEMNTCQEMGFSIPANLFRTGIVWGEVHDGNCHFMNGVSGHAGLFSTAFETFRIAQQFLAEESTLLKPETCELFRTNFTPGLNEARSFAFQLASTPESSAGPTLAPDSFGHLGFTGTSLWIEPTTRRIFILLTNRTHAHELPFVLINSVRRKFHELASARSDS